MSLTGDLNAVYKVAYANGVGYLGGDALGALYAANGGWAGVSTGTGAATSTAAGSAPRVIESLPSRLPSARICAKSSPSAW